MARHKMYLSDDERSRGPNARKPIQMIDHFCANKEKVVVDVIDTKTATTLESINPKSNNRAILTCKLRRLALHIYYKVLGIVTLAKQQIPCR